MYKKSYVSIAVLILALVSVVADAHSPPEGAKVYFIGLENGAKVKSPFKVQFGIKGFGITPAGTTGKRRHTAGHHHLLIDLEQLPDMDEAIPRDSHHIHFDQGETQAVIKLSPGSHTLQLLLGDEEHEPQDPPLLSERITVIVE